MARKIINLKDQVILWVVKDRRRDVNADKLDVCGVFKGHFLNPGQYQKPESLR